MRFDILEPAARRLTARLALLAALLLVGAPVAAAQTPSLPDPAADTGERNVGVLRSGDGLKMIVYREKELSGEFVIDSRGYVQIPGLGEVRAAGLGPSQLKDRIAETMRTRGYSNPDLSVLPLIRIAVIGQVGKPGLYPIDPGASLIQVISIAGGPSPEADLKRTRVVREGREFTVDLERAFTGSASGRIVLYSNDVVVVPQRRRATREAFQFGLGLLSSLVGVANLIVILRRP